MEDFNYNAGSNSFPSGHTLSAFALYGFLAFSSKNKTVSTVLLLALAVLVAISRVYLLQHFLQDILMGSVLGVGLAIFWYRIQFRFYPQPHTWLDNGLLRQRYLPADQQVPPVEEVEA
jgi:membrane-associated phospholipid phosphatase